MIYSLENTTTLSAQSHGFNYKHIDNQPFGRDDRMSIYRPEKMQSGSRIALRKQLKCYRRLCLV
jgi:hypothetical protein